MMRNPGGVAIGFVGGQPARNTRHPVSACLLALPRFALPTRA
jgi:hypothetical protein